MRWLLLFLFLFILLGPAAARAAMPSLSFTVNMSEAVNVDVTGGTPRIKLTVGDKDRYATYASGTGTAALVFTYAPSPGDLDLDGIALTSPLELNGGTITDLAGNPATLTYTAPATSALKVNYPSISFDFLSGASGRYTLNGTAYTSLAAFLTASGGSFTRGSVGTYYDAAGVLQTATGDTPRFDHDPISHARKGLLMEEASSNRFLNSGNTAFIADGGVWEVSPAGTVTPIGSTTAPDGTTVPVYNFGNVAYYRDVTISTGAVYTASLWVKANKAASIGFRIPGAPVDCTNNVTRNVDTTWQRISVTNLSSAQTIGRLLIDNRTGCSSVVSGLQISFWGTQMEPYGQMTSYIPTTTTAVSRPRESFAVPVGSWYTQTAYSLYSVSLPSAVPVYDFPGMVLLYPGSSLNSVTQYYQGSAIRAAVTGASTTDYSPSTAGISATVPNRYANGFAADNVISAFNGTLGAVDTSCPMPAAATVMQVGWSRSRIPVNGWLQELRYYPGRATNSDLTALTQ